MSDELQEFSYLRGMLSFRLPAAWQCGWDPINRQAVFYQDKEDAGVLRLALAKVLHYDRVMTLEEFARDLSDTNDITKLPDGSLLCVKTEQFDYDGVDYVMFSWYHMHDAPPIGAQVACFMYQASLFGEMQLPEFQHQMSVINQEIAATQWRDINEIHQRIRAVITPVAILPTDTIHYPLSEQVVLGLATVDDAGLYEYMTEADVESFGLSTDTAWQTAFTNMNTLISQAQLEPEMIGDVPIVCFSEDTYDQASLITATDLRGYIEPILGWPVMAIIPCRDFLHIFPSTWQPSAEQEKILAEMVIEEWKNSEDRISTELFRIDEEGIQSVGVFGPDGLHTGVGQENTLDDMVAATYPNPTSAADFYNRGLVYSGMLEHEKAIREFTSAISLDPAVADYYKVRAQEHALLGHNVEADEDARMAAQLGRRRRRP